MGPILVTGATGLIGAHVAAVLVEEGGDVRALARDPASGAGHPELDGVELVRGDLEQPASLAGLCADCEAVIHAAALLDGTPARIEGTNAIIYAVDDLRWVLQRVEHGPWLDTGRRALSLFLTRAGSGRRTTFSSGSRARPRGTAAHRSCSRTGSRGSGPWCDSSRACTRSCRARRSVPRHSSTSPRSRARWARSSATGRT